MGVHLTPPAASGAPADLTASLPISAHSLASGLEDISIEESATTESTTSVKHTIKPRHSSEGVARDHVDALASLLGEDVVQRIFALFNPSHVGKYNAKIGGMYTGVIKGKQAQLKVLALLDLIYPKVDSQPDRIWRSTNYETDEIWIGVPRSLPEKDRPMHKKQWALDREKREKPARQAQQSRDIAAFFATRAQTSEQTNESAPKTTWGSLATTRARTYQETFKLRGAKKPEEAVPAPTNTVKPHPPHVKARLAREAAAAAAAAAAVENAEE